MYDSIVFDYILADSIKIQVEVEYKTFRDDNTRRNFPEIYNYNFYLDGKDLPDFDSSSLGAIHLINGKEEFVPIMRDIEDQAVEEIAHYQ